jgi:hypothetical protein
LVVERPEYDIDAGLHHFVGEEHIDSVIGTHRDVLRECPVAYIVSLTASRPDLEIATDDATWIPRIIDPANCAISLVGSFVPIL